MRTFIGVDPEAPGGAFEAAEVAAKPSDAFDASLDYLAGLPEQAKFNGKMLERLDAIERLAEEGRELFFTLDAMLRDAKGRKAYAA